MQGLIRFLPPLMIAPLLLLAPGCDQITSVTGTGGPASGTCITGEAQLAVYDGFMQILCGCTEAAQSVPAGQSVTCTVGTGTTVYFWYPGDTLKHQITPTGTPAFATSPLFDPNASSPIRTHVIKLDVAGTYGFEDAFEPGLIFGSIVVQ